MKLKGLTRTTAPHLAESASHFIDFSQPDPNCAANWSTTINPMLCRVAAYSGPGFPRPAMSRIGGSVSPTGIVPPLCCAECGAAKGQRIRRNYLQILLPDQPPLR